MVKDIAIEEPIHSRVLGIYNSRNTHTQRNMLIAAIIIS
jgi:hypothetical protein